MSFRVSGTPYHVIWAPIAVERCGQFPICRSYPAVYGCTRVKYRSRKPTGTGFSPSNSSFVRSTFAIRVHIAFLLATFGVDSPRELFPPFPSDLLLRPHYSIHA